MVYPYVGEILAGLAITLVGLWGVFTKQIVDKERGLVIFFGCGVAAIGLYVILTGILGYYQY